MVSAATKPTCAETAVETAMVEIVEKAEAVSNPENGISSVRGEKNMGKLGNKPEESQDWTTPTKVTRSPGSKELRYGEVSIMKNSFSCLSDK